MSWRQTLGLRSFSFFKIPLIFLVSPSVVKLTSKICEIRIPLTWITRNHLGSMYFGVLTMGADIAGGLIAMETIRASKKSVALIFKDFKADFLRRPEADVHFTCCEGELIRKLVHQTLKTNERVNRTVHVVATTPSVSGDEPVARFELTLSLKAV